MGKTNKQNNMNTLEQFKQEMQEMSKEQLKLFYDHLELITLDINHIHNLRENNAKKDYVQRLLAVKHEIEVTYN